jgi:class 3 adenylate cyclase
VDGEPVETRYVAVGDADVAYQVVGDGPFDLLCCYGLGSQIDLLWELPRAPAGAFSSFARTIQFDRRGTGMSDAVPRGGLATWEEWTDDVRAVLDAAECERAAIYAEVDAGPIAVLFAATHPERVTALVLVNTWPRLTIDDDYAIGMTGETVDGLVRLIEKTWGTSGFVTTTFPSVAANADYVPLLARMLRAAATPRTAAAQFRYIIEHVDVRQALPLIQVPTLVLHNAPNAFIPIRYAHYLVDAIEGAKLVEIPSLGDANIADGVMVRRVVDEVAEFLTGERPVVEADRVLTTVLFTDIVASTERVSAMGDHRWRSLLESHDRVVRDQLRRFRGREVNTTGDGFFVSFDGPARAIRCGRAIIEAAANLGVELRAGLHSGECEVRGDDLTGLTVHIAARVGALAGAGELLVTSTVRDLVAGSDISFDDRGLHQLRGLADEWRLLAVTDT